MSLQARATSVATPMARSSMYATVFMSLMPAIVSAMASAAVSRPPSLLIWKRTRLTRSCRACSIRRIRYDFLTVSSGPSIWIQTGLSTWPSVGSLAAAWPASW